MLKSVKTRCSCETNQIQTNRTHKCSKSATRKQHSQESGDGSICLACKFSLPRLEGVGLLGGILYQRAICFCGVTGACDCLCSNADLVQTTSEKIIDTSKNILRCLIVNGSDAEKLTTSSCHEPPRFSLQGISKAEQLHHWILGIRQTLNSLFRLQPAIFFQARHFKNQKYLTKQLK